MELAEDLVVSVVARVLEKRRRELKVLERDIGEARGGPDAVPAHHLRRGGADAAGARACRSSGAATSAGPTKPRCREEFDRPVMVHRYPAAIKAFYMKPDPERAELALGVDVLAPGGLRRNHRRRRTARRSRSAAAADQGAQPAAGSVRVVSRPAPLRHGAARRLRHGHRARGRLDLRARARPRNDPVSAYAVQAVSVMRARGWRLEAAEPDSARASESSASIGMSVTMKIGLDLPRLSEEPRRLRGDARARAQAGHELTQDAAAADVLVVNTCAFIDSAKQESIDAILEMAQHKKDGACQRLIVTGCLAERYRDELQRRDSGDRRGARHRRGAGDRRARSAARRRLQALRR